MEQQVQRRLAAVLAADVAGYTRLMRNDEESTINTWWSYRNDIIDPTIAEYAGRIVKLTGDGFLAEFSSATSAVQAAFDMQRRIEPRARQQPEPQRMCFRMGVNLGEIYWDDDDIYGDDVNIAARLEGIANPGTVLISQSVFDRVKRNSRLTFENHGTHQLKNITEPVQAYRVHGDQLNHSMMSGNPAEALPIQGHAIHPNSLAVLPFSVFGADPEQVFFADGFTEDLITELARFKALFVSSRTASCAFRDSNLELGEAGRQLGVAYFVEGSVRRMGDRLRITAQLIRAETGDHVWAEKYDCRLDELFDLQDELARSIVSMVAGQIEHDSMVEANKKAPASMQAYECLLRGLHHHRLGGVTREDAEQALYWFNLAIEKDPQYGRAYAWRACARSSLDGWTGEEHWDEGVADTQRGLELDEQEAECHRLRGSIAFYEHDLDKVEYHFQRARELNPNNPWNLGKIADLYIFLGDGETALQYLDEARALDPLSPVYIREGEAAAQYVLGNYHEVVSVVAQLLHKSVRALAYRTAALSRLGEPVALKDAVEQLLAANPDFTIDGFLQLEFYREDDVPGQLAADLKKAGLR